jgi:hypothetical protein
VDKEAIETSAMLIKLFIEIPPETILRRATLVRLLTLYAATVPAKTQALTR